VENSPRFPLPTPGGPSIPSAHFSSALKDLPTLYVH
jgi:hypothetical protein